MAMSSVQIRENVNARILESLEKGIKPWVRPWSLDPNSGAPTSIVSRKGYQGVNTLLLGSSSMGKGYSGKYWATFDQWKKQGASVKPGEKATWIIYYANVNKKKQNEEDEDEKYRLLKMYCVFCIDQVHGESVDNLRPDFNATNEGQADYRLADETIKAAGAKFTHGGNSAQFSPTTQKIKMPYKSKFDSEESYYTTFFHELSHWADHAIGSKLGKRFGDEDYFFGELVAEISACYLSEACGIPSGKRWDDSVNYLGSWIERMKKDASWIMKASTRASQTCEYILNFSRKEEPVEA